MQVSAFYPNFFDDIHITYAATSLVEAMQANDFQVSMMGIASQRGFAKPFYQNAIPSLVSPIAYRLLSEEQLKKIAEAHFFYSSKNSEVAYLWPSASLALHKKIHDRGQQIVLETVNTHQATSKKILDAEYSRLGLSITHGITLLALEEESKKLELADYAYSCSPQVKESLLSAHFPSEKILDTSYGLKSSDILSPADIAQRAQHREVTAIFVGTIGVRKAPHLLLDYWCKSKVKGRLRLVGHIQPEVRHIIEPYLKREDIEHVPFTNDLNSIYREADLFVLPSLEEGSPLVTYLALGAGLPCLVSPMGGGGVIDNDKEGLIIAPHDEASWVEALQKMVSDAELRMRFSNAAYEKAPDYLWAEVGKKRTKSFLARSQNRLLS